MLIREHEQSCTIKEFGVKQKILTTLTSVKNSARARYEHRCFVSFVSSCACTRLGMLACVLAITMLDTAMNDQR